MKRFLSVTTFLLLTVLFLNQTTTLSQPSASIPKIDMQEYVGTYTFQGESPINSFVITLKDNDLYGEADSYGANKLLKQKDDDKFLSTSTYGSTIVFTRDGSTKKVTGLQLIIQGNTLEALKDK